MLPDKIHFGVIVKGHVAEMHEMPFPEVGPTDIVVKLIANNICTTDYISIYLESTVQQINNFFDLVKTAVPWAVC